MRKEIMDRLMVLILVFSVPSCIVIENQINGLPPGKWRGVIKLDPTPLFSNPKGQPLEGTMDFEFEEVDAGELPFIFEISKSNESGHQIFSVLNGSEKVYSAPVQVGRDLATAKDTVSIQLKEHGVSVTAIFEENIMEGWLADTKFTAWYGKDYLFTQLKKEPIRSISGVYSFEVIFQEDEQEQMGELTLQQDKNLLAGELILKGLKMNLEGTVQKDKIYLSGFNGAQAVLLQGKIDSSNSIFGTYRDLNQKIGFWKITI